MPTICLADLTEAQKRAYILADNRLAEKAGWDPELIALELATISQLDIDFDLADTGFETPEIDLLLGASGASGPGDAADDIPEIDRTKPTVSRLNDLWILGQHCLLIDTSLQAPEIRISPHSSTLTMRGFSLAH